MLVADFAFQCGENSLRVHDFAVRDAISTLFEITVNALSSSDDLDLDAIVGHSVAFRIGGTSEHARRWTGVVRHMKQSGVAESGLSSYEITIAPNLWLLTQRQNYRIFQHQTIIDIVGALLTEWAIECVWHVARERFPRLEMRVQYGETDFAFMSRLLEEAGVSFVWIDSGAKGMLPVFLDAPGRAEPRARGPLVYFSTPPATSDHAFVTDVNVSREVCPGKITIGDFDFRRNADVRLYGEASISGPETHYEQYFYEPGAFVVADGQTSETPVADDRGIVRSDETFGTQQTKQRLASLRTARATVTFQTNAIDLAPGTVVAIDRYPRSDVTKNRRLLVTELSLAGTQERSFVAKGVAVFADEPFVPKRIASKPRVHGVQSAVVVGPRAATRHEEIHTDEFGRVRVQFPWDREGNFDDRSSCWMRVSQGWAGGGFGMMAIPRVGQEVLVGFVDGDPDQPIVVGRVYNHAARVPYKLPEHKTKSVWRSASTPGSDGSNEIMFDDAKGSELVYVHAERNLDKRVEVNESVMVGQTRTKRVGADETISIGMNRMTTIGAADTTLVGERRTVTMRQTRGDSMAPTATDMVDGRISLTTGEATITLEGPNITLAAAANILMKAGAEIALGAGSHVTVDATVNMTLKSGAKLVVQADRGDVEIQGGPNVHINPIDRRKVTAIDAAARLLFSIPADIHLDEEIEVAEGHAYFDPATPDWFREKLYSDEWAFSKQGAQYKDFECFHLGAVGKALGLPEGAILRQMALRKKARGEWNPIHGDPGNGLWGGIEPFGLEPREVAKIHEGCSFYEKHYK